MRRRRRGRKTGSRISLLLLLLILLLLMVIQQTKIISSSPSHPQNVDGGVRSHLQTSSSAATPPTTRHNISPLSQRQWGINAHFASGWRPGELAQLSAAGTLARVDLFWDDHDKTENTSSLLVPTRYDTLLQRLTALDTVLLLTLGISNPLLRHAVMNNSVSSASSSSWMRKNNNNNDNDNNDNNNTNYTSSLRDAFVEWCLEVMRYFQGRRVIFELWNEPNDAWIQLDETIWGSFAKAEWYIDLLKKVGEGKASDAGIAREVLIAPALAAAWGGAKGPIDVKVRGLKKKNKAKKEMTKRDGEEEGRKLHNRDIQSPL